MALATVTRTWGSAPRQVGSHMAVAEDGEFAGSVSGGCIEAAVIQAAMAVIESGAPQTLEFGVTNEMAWEVGLACGGTVHVFVERVEAEEGNNVLRDVAAALREGRDVIAAVRLSDGRRAIAGAGFAGEDLLDAGGNIVRSAFLSAESRIAATRQGPVFLRPYVQPPCLVIVGAVHIAQTLAPMAVRAGFRTTVVDPREGFATEDRFPGITLVREWPDHAFPGLNLGRRSAVAVLAHDPKLDDPALRAALAGPSFYVGALGSRNTQIVRRERLAASGCTVAELDRIRGPIGVPIGAKTPEEIAVAVLAEVIQALRSPK